MARKSKKNVGLIGLGIIGSRVANALRGSGWHVYVWNRTPRAAPNFLASPRQIAELCDVIQLFVADAQALFDVLEAMGDALTPNHVILCNGTVGPEATREAARLVEERGAKFLDAPFTGSKGAAETKQLVYYIGGEDEVLQRVQPVLQASSKAIVKIGKIGDAAIIKVATNMISAVMVQTLVEAYAIVKESGIDPKVLREAVENNAIRSATSDLKLAKILDRDYEAHFSLKHMFKDVQLGIHIANALDIDLPATTATAGVMYGALTKGWGDLDFAALARVYQKDEPPAKAPAVEKPAEAAGVAEAPMVIELPAQTVGDGPASTEGSAPQAETPAAPDGVQPEKAEGEPAPAFAVSEPISISAETGAKPLETPIGAAALSAPETSVEQKSEAAKSDAPAARTPFIRRWFGAGTAS